jgi:hypothetical protein
MYTDLVPLEGGSDGQSDDCGHHRDDREGVGRVHVLALVSRHRT